MALLKPRYTSLFLLLVGVLVLAIQQQTSQAWNPQNQRQRKQQQQQQQQLGKIVSVNAPNNQRRISTLGPLSQTNGDTDTTQESSSSSSSSFSRDIYQEINGDTSSSSSSKSESRIIPAAMTGKSQLAAAFTALDESDQYDAVLTGLCAKILDARTNQATSTSSSSSTSSSAANENAAEKALQDPAALLQEMNDRKIPASPRSLMALIDATVTTQDALIMSDMLSLAIRNKNGLKQYGVLQSSILDLPALPTQKVQCPDGSRKTRQERLNSLPDVPTDDRGTEVASALGVSGIVGLCFLANLVGMDDITPYTNFIWFSIVSLGVVDNFYDVLKIGSNVAISSLNTTEANKEKMKIPEKDRLPFGLGSGKITGTVVRGLTRLLSVDSERECQCEAAALYVAYTLGLPCFAFRPNSLEAAYLIAQSIKENSPERSQMNLDPLLSNVGILKVLIWLMAPVAMESTKHPQLICSDPREASGLLKRLEDNAGKNNIDKDSLWWTMESNPEKEKADLLKWAYHEADILLRDNMRDVMEMSERLTGGAATIGDCVAAIEKW